MRSDIFFMSHASLCQGSGRTHLMIPIGDGSQGTYSTRDAWPRTGHKQILSLLLVLPRLYTRRWYLEINLSQRPDNESDQSVLLPFQFHSFLFHCTVQNCRACGVLSSSYGICVIATNFFSMGTDVSRRISSFFQNPKRLLRIVRDKLEDQALAHLLIWSFFRRINDRHRTLLPNESRFSKLASARLPNPASTVLPRQEQQHFPQFVAHTEQRSPMI